MTRIYIREIKYDESELINLFLDNAGNSLTSFRYFSKRPLSVIAGHLMTCLLMDDLNPIGYGHLDIEDEMTWLGIAVIESEQGKGYGKEIMSYLLNFATDAGIPAIHLSVDKNNNSAIQLYNGFDFQIEKELSNSSFLMKKNMLNAG